MGKELNKLYLNCEQVLSLPRHSIFAKRFAKQVIQHQIESGLETLVACHLAGKSEPIEILGFEELRDTILANKSRHGLVVVTGHMGSWEFVAKYSALAADEIFNAWQNHPRLPDLQNTWKS